MNENRRRALRIIEKSINNLLDSIKSMEECDLESVQGEQIIGNLIDYLKRIKDEESNAEDRIKGVYKSTIEANCNEISGTIDALDDAINNYNNLELDNLLENLREALQCIENIE